MVANTLAYRERPRDAQRWSKLHTVNWNDTIVAFVSVLEAAIIDDFFYRYRKCVKYPVLFSADGKKPTWLTVGGGIPTLVKVLGLVTDPDSGVPMQLEGVVEKVQTDDLTHPGIGPKGIKLIRLGVRGDEAKLISGWYLRNFGGLHLGQFVLGKISIGDNETVSKVAESVAELLARYVNESLASQALYYHSVPKELDWIIDAVGADISKNAAN